MDKKKKRGPDREYASRSGERRENYSGHKIVIPADEKRNRISIDGRSVYYSVTDKGEFFLDKYAYDRGQSLDEVVKRYIDYLDRVEAARKEGK